MWEKSIARFIESNIITKRQRTNEEEENKDYAHLLERIQEKLLTGIQEKSSSSLIGRMLLPCGDSRKSRITFHSIKELKESGIHVKPSNSNNLKNIYFYCNLMGTLKMPRLLVDESTAAKFMNLVALEMCPDF
ncbi:hypothetical protein PTKIN_Ptkin15bG0036700 [Pterospermum kingtungense]